MYSGGAEKKNVRQHLHVVNEESWSGVGRARAVGKYIGLDT